MRGVDLAPGPAFVWWQLALGAAIVAVGVASLPLLRLAGFRRLPIASLIRLAILVIGVVFAVRAFRTV